LIRYGKSKAAPLLQSAATSRIESLYSFPCGAHERHHGQLY
jgi:hypothetical protein